ncbi:lysosomal proton-coupled steroid conjugate and bile acid symporter SLC46A3-like [Dermacentor andersoni]|uniref:lysosomal proton-coupled steroid conjugate and bile acid symporter SLC46A3-like n=1 Tax=Dermacentor andersoni TaxID=34620 RepID=UPI0021555898|nr:proton-coupled folate transporter-like [Dermacentor andersoni]XP_054927690.1 proton-coupled folate transporter-like [Dermacentor andersoni]
MCGIPTHGMDFTMSSHSRRRRQFGASDFAMEAFAFIYIFAQYTSISVYKLLLTISECVYRGDSSWPDVVANSTTWSTTSSTNGSAQLLDECVDAVMNATGGTEHPRVRDLVFSLPLVELACSLLVCLMVGGWSDAHGRKLHFVLAMTGALIKDLSALVFVLARMPGRNAIYGVTIVSGLLGSLNLFTAGALCHVSDNSDHRSRTFRIGTLTFALYLGSAASVFVERLWKPLLASDSFVRIAVSVVGAQLVLDMVCLVGVAMVVRESLRVIPGYHGNPLWNFVSMRQVKDVAMFAARRRPSKARGFILVLCAVFLLERFVYCGEQEVWAEYLFRRFSWTHQASLMLGLQFVCEAMITMLAVWLAHSLGFRDSSLAIAGAVSFMGASAIKAIALTGGMHGIAVIVGSLSPLIAIAVLALLTKLIQPEEFGSLFANVAVLSIVAPLAASVAYWEVFAATKAMVSEFIYLLSIFVSTMLCLLLVYVRRNLHLGSLGNLIIQEEKVPLLSPRQRDFGAAIL